MRRVRMKTVYAGGTGTIDAGRVGALTDAEARLVVDAGYGEYADSPEPKEAEKNDEPVVETATANENDLETASVQAQKPKNGKPRTPAKRQTKAKGE